MINESKVPPYATLNLKVAALKRALSVRKMGEVFNLINQVRDLRLRILRMEERKDAQRTKHHADTD